MAERDENKKDIKVLTVQDTTIQRKSSNQQLNIFNYFTL